MSRLVVETGQEAGMVYEIGSTPITVGRSVECDIQVMDRRVSRRHATFRNVYGACVVEDLKSRNGTFLNYQPLVGMAQLRNGDRLSVGNTVLAYEVDPDEHEASASLLRRVRLTPGGEMTPTAEKSVTGDTEPLIGQAPVVPELMKDPVQRLRVLYQVSESLRADLDLETLLSKIMDILWMVVNPDRGAILIADYAGQESNLTPAVVKVRDEREDDIIISQGIVERSLRDKAAILTADAPRDARFSDNSSVISSSIRSAICTPLIANGQSLGVIYLDTRESPDGEKHVFSREDLDMVGGISVQAAMAIQNARLHQDQLKHQRLERELEIAREIQMSLLPQAAPEVPGVQFAASCLPARQVGGDYYDYFSMADNKIAVVIGDASGKGVPAAILISTARAVCRAQAQVSYSGNVNDIIVAVNRSLCSDALCENFASLFMLVYEPETRKITYTNAGHTPPLVISETGEVVRLDQGGPLLGVTDEANYAEGHLQLMPGDVVVMYTDGVTDTHNLHDELFAEERLTDTARRNIAQDAGNICDAIYRSVLQFRESTEPFDDLTLLIMKLV